MKRHTKLWDNLAREIDLPRSKRRIKNIKKTFAELSGAYSLSLWKRILNRIKGV